MHKNITISDLNVEIDGNGDNIKKHLVAKVGLGIIEVSLLYSSMDCHFVMSLCFFSFCWRQYCIAMASFSRNTSKPADKNMRTDCGPQFCLYALGDLQV